MGLFGREGLIKSDVVGLTKAMYQQECPGIRKVPMGEDLEVLAPIRWVLNWNILQPVLHASKLNVCILRVRVTKGLHGPYPCCPVYQEHDLKSPKRVNRLDQHAPQPALHSLMQHVLHLEVRLAKGFWRLCPFCPLCLQPCFKHGHHVVAFVEGVGKRQFLPHTVIQFLGIQVEN